MPDAPPLCARVTEEELVLTLPVPPTINHQYATVNGRRLLTAAGRQYKAFVAQQVMVALSRSPSRNTLLHRLQGDSLVLSIRFHFSSPVRRDVDGGLKITQDALCEALGVNDNKITEIHLYKQPACPSPHIEVAVRRQAAVPQAKLS